MFCVICFVWNRINWHIRRRINEKNPINEQTQDDCPLHVGDLQISNLVRVKDNSGNVTKVYGAKTKCDLKESKCNDSKHLQTTLPCYLSRILEAQIIIP